MKRKMHLLFLLLALLTSGTVSAQGIVYVDADVTGGNNDGSSWANAYNDLNTATAFAGPNDQIWVAEGTYLPDPSTPNNSFNLATGQSLYGGFDGTESSLDQRDPVAHPTILSGDLMGDDILDDLDSNRVDNSLHVLIILPIAGEAIVDGFTIQNGHTAAADPDLDRRGGGILCLGPTIIRNCHFTQNYGNSGGGVAAIGPGGSGVVVEDCTFDGNLSDNQCAGVFFREVTSGTVRRSTFSNNVTSRGCVYPTASVGVLVDSCLFENNDAGANFGAGMFTWQSDFEVRNSTFKGNTASNAAGMYNDGRDGVNSFTIYNCTFEDNMVTGFGGAGIYNWQCNYTIKKCTFKDNTAPNATGIYIDGRDDNSSGTIDSCLFEGNNGYDYGGTGIYNFRGPYTVTNSQFIQNEASSTGAGIYNTEATGTIENCLFDGNIANFGAGTANYSEGTEITYQNCTFMGNVSNTSGGALTTGFVANTTINDCDFISNGAEFGGAIYNQNDSTSLTVTGSYFYDNGCDEGGGAINASAGITVSIDDCLFFENGASTGGALYFIEDSLDLLDVTITNTQIVQNASFEQGGGIYVLDANLTMTNCLVAQNINFGDNYAGGLINNASENRTAYVKAVNCTFAENESTLGSGVTQWEDAAGTAIMEIQNCMFSHTLENYAIEEGDPELISLGGNLCNDNSMAMYLTQTQDINDTPPLFMDAANGDFHIMSGPWVDAGIAAGAPATDLDGNPRIGDPDIGAYEFGTTGVFQAVEIGTLEISPNPARNWVTLGYEGAGTNDATLQILDAEGRLIKTINQPGTRVDLSSLEKGFYLLQLSDGDKQFAGKLIKI